MNASTPSPEQFCPNGHDYYRVGRRRNGNCQGCERDRASLRARLKKFGLKEDDYAVLLERQGHVCALCQQPFKDDYREDPVLDHDHHTDKLRGIIHRRCNTAIGFFDDNPDFLELARAYVLRDRFHPTVTIWPFTVIENDVELGENVVIGSHSYIGRGTRIGAESRLQYGVFLPRGSQVGRRVFLGPGVTCTDDKHPRVGNPQYHAQPPIILDGASLGARVTLLPGVTIGACAVVGAGAVVTRDVPAGETYVGLPARLLVSTLELEDD